MAQTHMLYSTSAHPSICDILLKERSAILRFGQASKHWMHWMRLSCSESATAVVRSELPVASRWKARKEWVLEIFGIETLPEWNQFNTKSWCPMIVIVGSDVSAPSIFGFLEVSFVVPWSHYDIVIVHRSSPSRGRVLASWKRFTQNLIALFPWSRDALVHSSSI